MLAKDIKRGSVVVYNDAPCLIENVSVQSPSARGASTYYKYRARNLLTKQKVDIKLSGGESLNEADFMRRGVKLLYSDVDQAHFMDNENYEQYSVALEDVEEELKYVTEAMEGVVALIYNDECIGIEAPYTVELRVVECDPGIRGNSATSRTKPAKLETGLTIQVPEYLEEGELIKVDSRTAQFLGRAKE